MVTQEQLARLMGEAHDHLQQKESRDLEVFYATPAVVAALRIGALAELGKAPKNADQAAIVLEYTRSILNQLEAEAFDAEAARLEEGDEAFLYSRISEL
jgi:hypothetical protein